jgi:hypothetical protein
VLFEGKFCASTTHYVISVLFSVICHKRFYTEYGGFLNYYFICYTRKGNILRYCQKIDFDNFVEKQVLGLLFILKCFCFLHDEMHLFGSHFGQDTDSPKIVFAWFFCISPGKVGLTPPNRPRQFLNSHHEHLPVSFNAVQIFS